MQTADGDLKDLKVLSSCSCRVQDRYRFLFLQPAMQRLNIYELIAGKNWTWTLSDQPTRTSTHPFLSPLPTPPPATGRRGETSQHRVTGLHVDARSPKREFKCLGLHFMFFLSCVVLSDVCLPLSLLLLSHIYL